MSLCKSRSRENITAAAIVPFIEEQPTENKKLRFAKEKLRIFWCGVFCPLTGMVLLITMMNISNKKFSPPYGDGTVHVWLAAIPSQFSPPYGDGTMNWNEYVELCKFSPPYGDGTNASKIIRDSSRFSPPYGDGTFQVRSFYHQVRFSPPYGDGTLELCMNS